MASNARPAAPAPRLYLITPPIADVARLAEALPGALATADIAAVLARLAPGDERTLINRIKALASPVQEKNVALIVEGHPELVARAGADGCHLPGISALRAAVPGLKPDRIVGAGGLKTRDDAMSAGEAGADYVMFGEVDANGHRPSFAAIVDRVAWWAELFEVPCVACAASLAEIADLCRAGADFVAVGEAVFSDPRGLVAAVADAGEQLNVRAPA